MPWSGLIRVSNKPPAVSGCQQLHIDLGSNSEMSILFPDHLSSYSNLSKERILGIDNDFRHPGTSLHIEEREIVSSFQILHLDRLAGIKSSTERDCLV